MYRKTSAKSRSRRWTRLPGTATPATGQGTLPSALRTSKTAPRLKSLALADVRILGLDPGSLVTGYAIIECVGGKAQYCSSGCIRMRAVSLPERLAEIFSGVSKLVAEWQPHEVAVERVFMSRNADSALKLGQARGAAICGTLSSGARVFEYAPREIKQAVVGTGAAQKEQVQMMVTQLLRLNAQVAADMAADAADALAVAVCHAHSRQMNHLLGALQ